SLYCTVTADEQSGNLYKSVFVQDSTGAINLRLVNSGGLYQGDSIRVYLPGTILGKYQGTWQLDQVNVDNNVVKQATQRNVEPRTVTLSQLGANIGGELVRIENVEFVQSEACNGLTYADAIGLTSADRNISDCTGSTVIVRSSGYANFAGTQIASGNGTFTGIVGIYQPNSSVTIQLLIRNLAEVAFTGDRCDPCPIQCAATTNVQEDFSSTVANIDITGLPCWNNQPQTGARYWRGYSVNGDLCAQATAYGSTAAQDIAWLITPPVTYTAGMNLNFETQRGFGVAAHDPFALFISTNYTIGNPSSATWVPMTSAYALPTTVDQLWVPSGNVDLGAALPAGYTGSFVVGFRYTGSGTTGQTTNFRVDNVVIQ
ncbi:MAG: choice-of-anchor J domain-containing protein, partial [Flavobacteriales bacterium]|nr:choice-of-anchor J domain-containing protein [Flavobacteriales bacterium]